MTAIKGCGYVVASWQLTEEITKHRERLNTEYSFVDKNQNPIKPNNVKGLDSQDGWLTLIALRMLMYRPESSLETNRRWLFRVLQGESLAADADMADAALLACDQWMDHNTDVETFPGSRTQARTMVEEEAAFQGLVLTKEEILMLTQWQMDYRDRVIMARGVTASHQRLSVKRMERHAREKQMKQAA